MKTQSRKSILFMVDHKYRDLPGYALIGYYLKQMGFNVKFCALWNDLKTLREYNPDFIVLPKPIYAKINFYNIKRKGINIIIINTEGTPQDKKYVMRINLVPDLYFYWNQKQVEIESNQPKLKNTCKKIVGCYRLDFFHEKFKDLNNSLRNILIKNFDLKNGLKTVTVATSSQDVDFSVNERKSMQRKRSKNMIMSESYLDLVKNTEVLRKLQTDCIKLIARKYSNVQVIIKTHPNESLTYWKNLVKSLGSDNIKLIYGCTINELLLLSDLHITLNCCTTTLEALLMKVPVVELQTNESYKYFSSESLELAGCRCFDIKKFQEYFEDIIFNSKKQRYSKTVSKYIQNNFFKMDGLRCHAHAKEILNFEIRRNEILKIFFHFVYYFFLLKLLLGDILRKFKLRKSHHDKRSKFDTRIKNGDEEYWYSLFNKFNI